MEPQIEYATTSDGVRIATFAVGAGPVLLIPATPPWSHVQMEWRVPALRAWLEELAEQARVIRYDCRGTGLSDRDALDFSIEAQLRDLESVVEHYGLTSFAIWGTIGGSPAAIAYTARNPERVTHLMLWGAFASGKVLSLTAASGMDDLLRQNWELFTDAFVHAAFGWSESDTAAQYAELMRAAMTHEAMLAAMRYFVAMDVTADARRIQAPALILVRRETRWSGVPEARELASLIPGSRLLIVEGAAPAPFLGDTGPVVAAIRAFMATEGAPPRPRQASVPLTEREHQVLRLLANGRTGKEIAAELRISVSTAQRHIANIYAKIGARGRVEAATYAFERGLVPRRSPEVT